MNIIYQCSICGWKNHHKESVERCENSHIYKHQIEITDLYFESGDGVPKKIITKIKGMTYYFKRE